MGLGKTAQAISACNRLGAKRVLVLCPAVARFNWRHEFDKFSHVKRSYQVVRSKRDAAGAPDGVICSYDLARQSSINTWLRSAPWDVVVLDEAHYLKNRTAQRTKAAFSLAHGARLYALTGTPAPNHAGELWPLLRHCGITDRDYWSFVRRYCVVIETPFGTEIKGHHRIPELRELLAPFMLRRKKDDVLQDLPPIQFCDVVVEAGPVDTERYFADVMRPPAMIEREHAEQIAAIEAIVNVTGFGADGITALAGLQTRCAMSRRYTGLQKVPALVEIVTEELRAKPTEKLVIFCVHRDVMVELQERLKDFGPVTVYGGTPAEKRVKHQRAFDKDPKCRVFIGNIQAAGVAINLTVAHEVVFAEASWVPAENAQAAMRCHRIGQTQPVRVRFFLLADSVDEKIMRVLKRKTRDLVSIFDPEAVNAEPVINPFAD